MSNAPNIKASKVPRAHAEDVRHLRLAAPWVVGLLVATVVGAIMAGIIVVFHLRMSGHLEARMHNSLRRAAIAAAQSVDPVIHQSLVDPSQEGSAAYDKACARLERTRAEFEGPEKLRFVYTCVLRDGQVHFVLDPTPAGDADGDGVDDKAHLMELYDDASEELLDTLRGGGVKVMKESYTDRWGTFLSAYAPIVDNDGVLVAAAGVDMDLSFFNESLANARRDSLMAGGLGMMLAALVGIGAAFYEKRLIKSVDSLNHAMERAMAGERAKGRFLATMSHEFRTPMNAIVGSAELLCRTRLDGFQAEHAQTIIRSSGSLLAMLDDVLDYSRAESGQLSREPVDLRALCADIISAFREEAERKGLVLEMGLDPGVPARWFTNSRNLQRILSHLVSNAVKFTSCGEVRLWVEPTVDEDGRQILRFRVSDTGIGIGPDQLHKVFEPFAQLDASANRRHEGAGLGLALCERLCRELDTALDVQSEPGKGSTFGFLLPGEAAPDATSSAAGRAILISNDRLQRRILTRLLEKRGWSVAAADDLDGAARLSGGDCVIFDLAAVPGDSAVEYARQVAGSLPADCHVAIDAGLDERARAALLGAGIRRVICRSPGSADLDWLDAPRGLDSV